MQEHYRLHASFVLAGFCVGRCQFGASSVVYVTCSCAVVQATGKGMVLLVVHPGSSCKRSLQQVEHVKLAPGLKPLGPVVCLRVRHGRYGVGMRGLWVHATGVN